MGTATLDCDRVPPAITSECLVPAEHDKCLAKKIEQAISQATLELHRTSVRADWDIAEKEQHLRSIFLKPGREAEVARIRKELHDASLRDHDRAKRIRKILSYARTSGSKGTFPHNSTLTEWYDWERFDAYRMLGFQEAITYLDRFEVDEPSYDADDIPWCRFTRFPYDKADNWRTADRCRSGYT